MACGRSASEPQEAAAPVWGNVDFTTTEEKTCIAWNAEARQAQPAGSDAGVPLGGSFLDTLDLEDLEGRWLLSQHEAALAGASAHP